MSDPVTASPEAQLKARKRRNLWLALALFTFSALVGVTTMVRLADGGLKEGGFYYNVSDDRKNAIEPGTELPPGMSAEQAAPPPGLEPEPAEPKDDPS